MTAGDCGHDLKRQAAQPVGECYGAAAIYRCCGLKCEGPELPSEFTRLPLQALLEVLFFLGRMDIVIAQGNPNRLATQEMLTDWRLLEAGARIALGWPGTFDDLAIRVRAAYSTQTKFSKQYDYLHRFIMNCGDAPYADLLQAAYATHLARRNDVSEKAWPEFLPRPNALQISISSYEARKLLGLGIRSFAALSHQPLWTDLVPLLPARNGTRQFSQADVLALKVKLARLVTPHVLDDLLGIGRGKGRQLCDAGLVPVHMWNRHHKRGEERSVDMTDVEMLRDRIRRFALPTRPTQPVSFPVVVKRAADRRVLSFSDVMRSILVGQLRGYVAEPGKSGLASMSFEEADVIRVLDELSHPSRTGKMCLGDVVRRLGIPAKAVRELVRIKLLPEPIRRGGYIFNVNAVEELRNSFTYDTVLAKQQKSNPLKIRNALLCIGVRPMAVVPLRGSITTAVYRKTELDQPIVGNMPIAETEP